MDVAVLEELGLTQGEGRVYLGLLELGSSKAGKVIEKSRLQSSVVHNALHSLLDKGFISYVKKGKIRVYSATDPKHFIDFIDEKKKKFEKILPQLEAKKKILGEQNEAEVYEGFKGVRNLLLEVLDGMKKRDEWLFFSADVEGINRKIQNFYKRLDPKRKEKEVVVKGIAPLRMEHLFTDRIRKGFMEMRFSHGPILPNMSITKGKVAMFHWGDKPVGYLIKSEQLADKYANFFYATWNGL